MSVIMQDQYYCLQFHINQLKLYLDLATKLVMFLDHIYSVTTGKKTSRSSGITFKFSAQEISSPGLFPEGWRWAVCSKEDPEHKIVKHTLDFIKVPLLRPAALKNIFMLHKIWGAKLAKITSPHPSSPHTKTNNPETYDFYSTGLLASWLFLVLIIVKLDGVGPVDNRPSTD